MSLPTLYKRRSDGKIQSWSIEVDGPKYRTVSGTLEGDKVTSEWTLAVVKNAGRANATTPGQQALAEAKAEWQKKRDKGYAENQEGVDKAAIFQPMLAHKYEDYRDELEFPVYCQPKLDGIRCIATPQGLFSRNGKPILSAPHIHEAVLPILNRHQGLLLDGELYCDKLAQNFNEIVSLVRKSKPSKADLEESKKIIQYWVYDATSADEFEGPIKPWEDTFSKRHAFIAGEIRKLGHPSLVPVETLHCEDEDVLRAFYEQWLASGFEGQMVRVDACYKNKRSKYLLKRKEFLDDEFEVLGVHEGVGNRSGMAGYMSFHTKEGKPFDSNIKGGVAFYKQLWADRKKLIGQKATVRYFKPTPDGIPRFPFVVAIRNYE
jgi:DNA ligase-1